MNQHLKKMGYNGYVFKPEDWIEPSCSNRLSCCRGKYAEPNFGFMTHKQLIDMFDQLCPHFIMWEFDLDVWHRVDQLITDSVGTSRIPRSWMEENIRGYWRDLSFSDTMPDGKVLGMWRSAVRFQNKEDAILFKLTWC